MTNNKHIKMSEILTESAILDAHIHFYTEQDRGTRATQRKRCENMKL